MNLLLASTSSYRNKLLQRLQIPFECRAPRVEETPLPGEAPGALARRLASLKADAVASGAADTWVLGSDQVASIDGSIIGKPGDHHRAAAQLRASSGKQVAFYTAVALVNHSRDYTRDELVITRVNFRTLGDPEIDAYLRADTPYDCAGSFKCEALGIALFESIQSDDPTALEGLPLIATCRLLRDAGFDIPGRA